MKPLRPAPGSCLTLALASSLWLFFATGCVVPNALTPDKAYWQKRVSAVGGVFTASGYIDTGGTNPPLVLNATNLASYVTATETNGSTRVAYSPGCQPQAALLARLADSAVAQAKAQVGWSAPARLHFYLVHLPDNRRPITYSLPTDDAQSYPVLVPLTNGNVTVRESPPSGLPFYLDCLQEAPDSVALGVHELCEGWLAFGPANILVLPDYPVSWGVFSWEIRYHTRWFREGYATYAGYWAQRAFCAQVAQLSPGSEPLQLRVRHLKPFSKLAKVKADIFAWNQTSKPDLDGDNYQAALGLFLLIEQRLGADAIRTVIRELPQLERPDGPAILKLFRTKTGVDLKEMVRDFDFPDFGLTFHAGPSGQVQVERVRPASPAAVAGLRAGDEIQQVNGQRTYAALDYELGMFQALEAGTDLRLTVLRQGQVLILLLVRGNGGLGACGRGAQPDLPAQLLALNLAVAAKTERHEPVTAPSLPPGFP